MTDADTAIVAPEASGISLSVSKNLITGTAQLIEVDRGCGHAQHSGELPECHLDPDAGEEPDEHRGRDEVRQKAEPGDAREQEKAARDERREARVRDPLVCAWFQTGISLYRQLTSRRSVGSAITARATMPSFGCREPRMSVRSTEQDVVGVRRDCGRSRPSRGCDPGPVAV